MHQIVLLILLLIWVDSSLPKRVIMGKVFVIHLSDINQNEWTYIWNWSWEFSLLLGRKLLYMVWSLCLCQYCSICSIFNYWIPVQDTIYLLSGECRCVDGVDYHEFELYTPIVLMVNVQNCVQCIYVCILRVHGWVRIAATCWVSWWLGERVRPKIIKVS